MLHVEWETCGRMRPDAAMSLSPPSASPRAVVAAIEAELARVRTAPRHHATLRRERDRMVLTAVDGLDTRPSQRGHRGGEDAVFRVSEAQLAEIVEAERPNLPIRRLCKRVVRSSERADDLQLLALRRDWERSGGRQMGTLPPRQKSLAKLPLLAASPPARRQGHRCAQPRGALVAVARPLARKGFGVGTGLRLGVCGNASAGACYVKSSLSTVTAME